MTEEDACKMVGYLKALREIIKSGQVLLSNGDGGLVTTEDVQGIISQLCVEPERSLLDG